MAAIQIASTSRGGRMYTTSFAQVVNARSVARQGILLAAVIVAVALPGCGVLQRERAAENTKDIATGKFVQLTTDGNSCTKVGMGWSPDGKHILFEQGLYANDMRLCIMDPDGKNIEPISDVCWHRHWGWSPDSKKIVFDSYPNTYDPCPGTLFMYDLVSKRTKKLRTGFVLLREDDRSGWGFPVWTKDSKVFVIRMNRENYETGQGDDFLFNIETGKVIQLTPKHYTTGGNHVGSWSPDGKYFAMQSKKSEESNFRIWICRRDGSGLHPITPPDWQVYGDPCWSPKGDLIAFSTDHGRLADEINESACDVWTVKPDGTGLRQLTHGSSPDFGKRMDFGYPEWTWDAKYISCISHKFDKYGNPFSGIALIDLKTGEHIPVFENDPNSDVVFYGMDMKNSNRTTKKHIAFIGRYCKIQGRETGDPTYSEDGDDVLYSYDIESKKLSKISEGSSKPFSTALFYDGFFLQPYWSPDDRKLLFIKDRHYLVPEDENEDLYLYEP